MRYFIAIFLLINILFANSAEKLAKELSLVAGTKAIIQWERVFSSQRRMKKYKINTLTTIEIDNLKKYLIKHAADSDQPVVPGL